LATNDFPRCLPSVALTVQSTQFCTVER
jgi:hypothetical protein